MSKKEKESGQVSSPISSKLMWLGGMISLLVISALYLQYSVPDKEDISFKEKFNRDYKVYAINLPSNLVLMDEHVPLEQFNIAEKLDRELLVNTYWQSQTLLFFKRSQKWFPMIESILEEEGVPNDFKYLAIIESGLNNIVSPSGAAGFWQIMKSTGREYGLEVNSHIDERYHLEKATRAACTYLKKAYEMYGSWSLAAASYNMGMNGMNRKLTDQQVNSYYDLHLNTETARYVYRMIAVKLILENPNDFGFNYREKDLYKTIPTSELSVDTAIPDLSNFANAQGYSYSLLKTLNPWLRSKQLANASNKNYSIKVPTKTYLESVDYRKPEPLPQFAKTE